MGTATVEGGGRHKRWFVPPSQRVRKGEVSPGRSCDAHMTRPSEDGTLRRSLESAIGPEKVRMDDAARRAYSTDASPCAVEPRAVAFVETEEEVLAVLRACRELDVPVTPRASGTSLSGAAIGPGVVMDTTRFKRILEFDPARGLVRVEPGILLSELNAHLAERGMRFAPDPGSQDLCRIGGMGGHNASGDRSVKYGQTGDHILQLKGGLVYGTSLRAPDVRPDSPEWAQGTRLAEILAWGPSAIEAVDGGSLALLDREALGVPPKAQAMLLVEFDDGDLAAIADGVVGRIRSRYRLSQAAEVAFDTVRQSALWKVRRAVFPTIIQRPGPRKAWGFVEDPIVPRDRVPAFIEFLAGLARRHGTEAGIYGHIGDGNTHYRPFFDPTDPADFERMQALRAEFDDAVLNRFRGAPSGEHGIGRIRAETLPRVWGPEGYGIMLRIKEALDPRGILNPGVILSTDSWWATWGGLESRVPM